MTRNGSNRPCRLVEGEVVAGYPVKPRLGVQPQTFGEGRPGQGPQLPAVRPDDLDIRPARDHPTCSPESVDRRAICFVWVLQQRCIEMDPKRREGCDGNGFRIDARSARKMHEPRQTRLLQPG